MLRNIAAASIAFSAIATSSAGAQSTCLARYQDLYTGAGTVISQSIDPDNRVAILIENNGQIDEVQVFKYRAQGNRWIPGGTFVLPTPAISGTIDIEGPCISIAVGTSTGTDILVYGEAQQAPGVWVNYGTVRPAVDAYAASLMLNCGTGPSPGPGTGAGPAQVQPIVTITSTELFRLGERILLAIGDLNHLNTCTAQSNPISGLRADGAVWLVDLSRDPEGTDTIVPTAVGFVERSHGDDNTFYSLSAFGASVSASGTGAQDEARLIVGAPGLLDNAGANHVGGVFIYELLATSTVARTPVSISCPVYCERGPASTSVPYNFVGQQYSSYGFDVAISDQYAFCTNRGTFTIPAETQVFVRIAPGFGGTWPSCAVPTSSVQECSSPLNWGDTGQLLPVTRPLTDRATTRVVGLDPSGSAVHYQFVSGTALSQVNGTVPNADLAHRGVGSVAALAGDTPLRFDCTGVLDFYVDHVETVTAGIAPNSTGQVGDLTLTGSINADDGPNGLTLLLSNLPPNQSATLLVSDASRMTPAGGFVLLQAPIRRVPGVFASDSSGNASKVLDTDNFPHLTGPVMAGTEVWLQCIHRDPPLPDGRWGTEAIGITFQ